MVGLPPESNVKMPTPLASITRSSAREQVFDGAFGVPRRSQVLLMGVRLCEALPVAKLS